MLIVVVSVKVKPERVGDFRRETLANARESVKEPGIARFDVLQDKDDASHFALVEVYRTPDAPAAHRQTAHYAAWRDAVEEMMAEPRSRIQFENVFPDDAGF
jgi:(4S)-4-hydroxy-5-phosphonooxypentane-2,3-dione isomerase